MSELLVNLIIQAIDGNASELTSRMVVPLVTNIVGAIVNS